MNRIQRVLTLFLFAVTAAHAQEKTPIVASDLMKIATASQLSASPDGKRFTWLEAQQYLGPPDLYDGPMDRPNGVVYLYDRYAKKDWAVFVLFNSQGKTRHIGVNATVANNLAGWSTYPTTSPATVPVNAEP